MLALPFSTGFFAQNKTTDDVTYVSYIIMLM